jgi:hypothetical protein
MNKLPPSFMGTLIATILATGYIILDENKFHLWTPFARYVILGGASLVLVTYSISWFLLESYTGGSRNAQPPVRGDYWIRLTAQTLLGLSLAALGISVGAFLGLFVGFIAISFVWTFLSFRSARTVLISEAANFLLCTVYAGLAFKLYLVAIDFEHSYPAMVGDHVSYDVRVKHLRGEIQDPLMFLSLVVGAILANLIVLFGRSPWIKGRKVRKSVSVSHER